MMIDISALLLLFMHSIKLISSTNFSNCTDDRLETFNLIRNRINKFRHQSYPTKAERPIDPICILPDYNFSYHFLPNFYCESWQSTLNCNKTQELLFLKQFYKLLNGQYWANHRNWNNDAVDYCEWHGIYCCNTSYPLYKTCINGIYLNENNLTGPLPSSWPNSTVFTMFSIGHNNITGTIPNYHESLPNLVLLEIDGNQDKLSSHASITGSLPPFPKSNCMIWLQFNKNPNLGTNLSLPDWSDQKYMYYISAEDTNFIGTIPSWDSFIWPYQIILNKLNNKLYGTIPQFTSAVCPTLSRLYLNSNSLTGTVPALPPQHIDNYNNEPEIHLFENKLSGTFPWYSLDRVAYLGIQQNNFIGNIELNNKYDRLIGFNVSSNNFNGMIPCFMAHKDLQLFDARFNKFTSVATDTQKNCKTWPNSLKFLLLSNNKINAKLHGMLRNATDFSILDVGNNELKGTVPELAVTSGENATYISFYDNDISCAIPAGNGTNWKQSWLYVGHSSKKPWAPYTNQWEKGLGIIVFQPQSEVADYLIAPIIIGFVMFICYMIIWKRISSSNRIRLTIFDGIGYKEKHSKEKILYIMQQSLIFLVSLCIIGIILSIIYILGANFVDCGYVSLQPTIAYLGTQEKIVYNIYSWISLILFAIYSFICTIFVSKLQCLTKQFTFINKEEEKKLIPRSSINSPDAISEESEDATCTNNSSCIVIIGLILKLIVLIIVLFGPIFVYNIYHSIPYTNTKIPDINNIYFQYFVLYALPSILAIGKFFGIPYGIDQVLFSLKHLGIKKYQKLRNYENAIIYFIRLFTMIFIPVIVLLIFDDACFQNWKLLWNYCEVDKNGNLKHIDCIVLPIRFAFASDELVGVCHKICNKEFIAYRCIRRFIQVLAPLYLYKMNIALWFPLLYYLKKSTFITKYLYKLKKCNLCRKNNRNKETIKIDVEYMSLISSLEIVIIFGWAIPLLILLYTITIFGYFVIYSYWFNHKQKKFKNKHQLQPVSKGLIFSLILQHSLSILFYWLTQSKIHGYICIVICFINFLIFSGLMAI